MSLSDKKVQNVLYPAKNPRLIVMRVQVLAEKGGLVCVSASFVESIEGLEKTTPP